MIDAHDVTKRWASTVRAAAAHEAAIYARNGLERLAALVRALPGTDFQFEVEITAGGRTGFIDCLGSGGGVLVLLDFKRSSGSNPEFPAWEEGYPKIQLWFYLRALQEQGLLKTEDKLAVGYLFFKDLDKSWVACESSVASVIDAVVPDWAEAWDDRANALERYGIFEDELRHRLNNESVFAPLPRDPDNCGYCSLRALCPKGTETEEAQ